MSKTSDIISYYRDCISVDLKAISIDNFFGKEVSHQHVLKSFEHLTSSLYELPVDSVWGKELDEELILHSKEKQLYTGAIFLKGKIKRIGKMVSTFTPLFLYESFLQLENDVYYISVNRENPIFNPAFFEYLRYELGIGTEAQKQIIKELPTGVLDFDALIKIKELIESLSDKINIDKLADFIASDQATIDLQKVASSRSKKHYLRIILGAAFGLAKKSKGAMGVLQELDELIQHDKSSDLLTEVFGVSKPTRTPREQEVIHTPASLSESQKEVFKSLDINKTTLVIGPPGTGKTFTIANLAANIIGEGKSALIVCKTSQASNVVVDKIQNDLKIKGKLINATSLRYKKSIESRLSNILFSLNSKHPLHGEHDALKKQIIDIDAKINLAILTVIESEKEEIEWGKLYFSNKNRFVKMFFSKWIEYKKSKKESISYFIESISKLEKSKSYKVKRYLEICIDPNTFTTNYSFLEVSITPTESRENTQEERDLLYAMYVDFYMDNIATVTSCFEEVTTLSSYIKMNCVEACHGISSEGPSPVIYVPCSTGAQGCCIEKTRWCRGNNGVISLGQFGESIPGDCTGNQEGICNSIEFGEGCIPNRCR